MKEQENKIRILTEQDKIALRECLSLLDIGWDAFIDRFVYVTCYSFDTIERGIIFKCIDNYYKAYDLAIDNDFDSGMCFVIRQKMVETLITMIEEVLK